MDVNQTRSYAQDLKSLLGLETYPVGVILDDRRRPVSRSVLVTGHRYCQALMRARRGEAVTLEAWGNRLSSGCPRLRLQRAAGGSSHRERPGQFRYRLRP